MKKYIVGFIVGAIVTTSASSFAEDGFEKVTAYVRATYNVVTDGKSVTLDNPAIVYDGYTYLRLRDAAKVFEKDVIWNEATQTAELNSRGVEKSSATPTPIQKVDKIDRTSEVNKNNNNLGDGKLKESENQNVLIEKTNYKGISAISVNSKIFISLSQFLNAISVESKENSIETEYQNNKINIYYKGGHYIINTTNQAEYYIFEDISYINVSLINY